MVPVSAKMVTIFALFTLLTFRAVSGLQCYSCDWTPGSERGHPDCGPEPDDRYLVTADDTQVGQRIKQMPIPYQNLLNNGDDGSESAEVKYYCTLMTGISDMGDLVIRRGMEIAKPTSPCRDVGPPFAPMSLCYCDTVGCNGSNSLNQNNS